MSEMLPDDTPVQVRDARAAGATASANWLDRWIDIAQVAPRPRRRYVVVVLAFFAFLLIFATIEILLRNNEQQK
jgi:hypothetical protein